MATVKPIPKQYRVTFKPQVEQTLLNPEEPNHKKYQWERTPGNRLGFANVYEPDTKAYAKRKKTQDDWAYTFQGVEKDGVFWQVGRAYRPDPKNPLGRDIVMEVNEPFPAELQPIIIDNDPLEGFKVVKSVSRYSTSNKLWRILDPRGFELEISSATFEDLILGGDIQSGLIIGACIWSGPKILVRV